MFPKVGLSPPPLGDDCGGHGDAALARPGGSEHFSVSAVTVMLIFTEAICSPTAGRRTRARRSLNGSAGAFALIDVAR